MLYIIFSDKEYCWFNNNINAFGIKTELGSRNYKDFTLKNFLDPKNTKSIEIL